MDFKIVKMIDGRYAIQKITSRFWGTNVEAVSFLTGYCFEWGSGYVASHYHDRFSTNDKMYAEFKLKELMARNGCQA